MSFVIGFLSFGAGALVGAGFAIYRLKGAMSALQAAKVVIQGGGGPGEEST